MFEEKEAIVGIDSEALAYWFFRLNGFLTITNFVVHPDSGREQRTDVDILGVRFPYRSENRKKPMADFRAFTEVKDKPYIIIAEVKERTCNLNGSWTHKHQKNINRVLAAVGVLESCLIDEASEDLYNNGAYENSDAYVSLVCVGDKKNRELGDNHPQVPQVTWDQVLGFIFGRFSLYYDQKANHPQWDKTGKLLWNCFRDCRGEFSQFQGAVRANAPWIMLESNR